MQTIDEAIEWIYGLHVGVVGKGASRHERPHKPVLLLAVLDLIASGQSTPDHIPWSQALRDRFTDYFTMVRKPLDQNNPNLPFYHLQQDEHWRATNATTNQVIAGPPMVREVGRVFASLTDGLERFVVTPADRLTLRYHIISRYFPKHKAALEFLFREGSPVLRAAEDEEDDYQARPGRSSAFRKKILDIYDCQCAACGLRIRMPEVRDLTFVDAAHLIPYSEQPNDHPTNGIALCKNHHWAMDRFLIAPCPDGLWKVSPKIIPHRSPGEKDLANLAGKPLLPPHEPAFAPSKDALAWRCERLAV